MILHDIFVPSYVGFYMIYGLHHPYKTSSINVVNFIHFPFKEIKSKEFAFNVTILLVIYFTRTLNHD